MKKLMQILRAFARAWIEASHGMVWMTPYVLPPADYVAERLKDKESRELRHSDSPSAGPESPL